MRGGRPPGAALERIAFGPLRLGGLAPGTHRRLSGLRSSAYARSDTIALDAQRLFALRGAISVKRNDAQDILDATTELMKAIMERNSLRPSTS